VYREILIAGTSGFLSVGGAVPEPNTIYREVRALPAGTYMIVNHIGQLEKVNYFSPASVTSRSVELA